MALESSIVPVPSEVVMPPAAFWAAQGQMDFWGVVLAGTLGSYFGSAVSYVVAGKVGRPFIRRYGKYVLLGEEKLDLAQVWVNQYGVAGIFIARLLPVIRHLISIPAGLCRMSFSKFSVVTLVGAGLWCLILSWFGQSVLGDHPELLNSPEDMVHVIKDQMFWFVVAIVIVGALYGVVLGIKKRSQSVKSA